MLLSNTIKNKKMSQVKKNRYTPIIPFPNNFVKTSDNYTCSFYLSKSDKWNKILDKMNIKNATFTDINIPLSYFRYKISRKSKIYSKVNSIKLETILNKTIKQIFNFKFSEKLLKNILDNIEKYFLVQKNISENNKKLLKEKLLYEEEKLKNILNMLSLQKINVIEYNLLEKQKKETIYNIASLNKDLLNNNIIDLKSYINKFFYIRYFLVNNKDFLYSVGYQNIIEIFVSHITIS